MTKRTYILLILSFVSAIAFSQDRFSTIDSKLKELSFDNPGLEEKVELSVNGVSIQEFIRGIAVSNKLNISVDPELDLKIVNNFVNVSVSDVLLFLARKYDLEYSFIGNIIAVGKYEPPIIEVKKKEPEKLAIQYNLNNKSLSYDLKVERLDEVTKEITRQSSKNIILSPGLSENKVSGFVQNLPLEEALNNLAFSNNLVLNKTESGIYIISAVEPIASNTSGKNVSAGQYGSSKKNNEEESENYTLKIASDQDINLNANNAPIMDIVKKMSDELGVNYFLFSDLKGTATLNLEHNSYEKVLYYLLNATDYTYKSVDGIYIFGERKIEGLRATKVYQLQYRTVEKVMDFIPQELKKDLDIKEFNELNSLVLSGSEPKINELILYLKEIDKLVPVVMIEIIVLDYKKSKVLSTGIEAGLGSQPTTTGGTLYPGVDVQLGAQSVNDIINSLNGFGIINLGKVTSNFYLSINALESQGIVKVKSTPKLATLNSHEATLSIGNTEYYLEVQNNVVGTQNPQNITTQTYKPVKADLAVTIKPFVSGDEQITLEITVDQSSFTNRITQNAPPGSVSRSFSSIVRVKNQETILLGGLEEKKSSDTGSGVPFLSRIPVIKWLFSSRTRDDSKSRLNILIKPTVIY